MALSKRLEIIRVGSTVGENRINIEVKLAVAPANPDVTSRRLFAIISSDFGEDVLP